MAEMAKKATEKEKQCSSKPLDHNHYCFHPLVFIINIFLLCNIFQPYTIEFHCYADNIQLYLCTNIYSIYLGYNNLSN